MSAVDPSLDCDLIVAPSLGVVGPEAIPESEPWPRFDEVWERARCVRYWTGLSDDELFDGLVARAEPALEAIVQKYRPVAMALARNILLDEGEAEDAFVDAFQRLWDAAPRLNQRYTLRYLVCHLSHNAAIDLLRKRRGRLRKARGADPSGGPQRRRVELVSVDPAELPEGCWSGPSTDDLVIARVDARRLVERATRDALGEGRAASAAHEWLLVDVGGLSAEEVAGNRSVPASTVRSRVGWYRRRLQGLIEDG